MNREVDFPQIEKPTTYGARCMARLDLYGVYGTIQPMKEAGLDRRHRDEDGEIDRKHGNTLVGTLRKTYGDDFLSDWRADAKLETVLEDTGAASLSQLVKKHQRQ